MKEKKESYTPPKFQQFKFKVNVFLKNKVKTLEKFTSYFVTQGQKMCLVCFNEKYLLGHSINCIVHDNIATLDKIALFLAGCTSSTYKK